MSELFELSELMMYLSVAAPVSASLSYYLYQRAEQLRQDIIHNRVMTETVYLFSCADMFLKPQAPMNVSALNDIFNTMMNVDVDVPYQPEPQDENQSQSDDDVVKVELTPTPKEVYFGKHWNSPSHDQYRNGPPQAPPEE